MKRRTFSAPAKRVHGATGLLPEQTRWKRWRKGLGAAIILCAGLVGLSLMRTSHDTAPRAVAPALSVLDSPATGDDTLPAQVVTFLSDASEPEFSAEDRRQARRILANDPGWLVPASGGELCLVRVTYPASMNARNGGLAPAVSDRCLPQEAVEAGQLVEVATLEASVVAGPTRIVVGIVPDGVSAVDVKSASGGTSTVPVDRNAYEVVTRAPTLVRFRQPAGETSVPREIMLPPIRSAHAAPSSNSTASAALGL
jgi:hypothetical protein